MGLQRLGEAPGRFERCGLMAMFGLQGVFAPLSLMTVAMAIGVALLMDRLWGEPPTRWHPVAWMGRALGWMGRLIAPAPETGQGGPAPWLRFGFGATAWCVGAAVVTLVAWGLQAVTQGWHGVLTAAWLGIWLKPLLAWRMLRDEVVAVESALGQSLEAGRARLAWLVSRDVRGLDAGQVRESAIETLAENLNDSVVAPLFWFAVAGLPGAALYRFANTADAMWGYLGERQGRDWTWAGKWAARADDVLSWVPARITALLLVGQGAASAGCGLPSQARRTPSPNSGWPMAAMALVLGVRLSKPGVYALNETGRSPVSADVGRALRLASRAVQALVALAGLVVLAWLLPGLGRAVA